MRSNKPLTLVSRWSVAIVALGIALTIAWIAAFAWLPLHFLGMM